MNDKLIQRGCSLFALFTTCSIIKVTFFRIIVVYLSRSGKPAQV